MFLRLVNYVLILLLLIYTDASAAYKTNSLRELGIFQTDECKADAKEPWSYRGKNGPDYWEEIFPTCGGKHQSPIAINNQSAVYDKTLAKLSLNKYEVSVRKAIIENNGHSVQITPTDGVDRTIVVNGSTYNLVQLHFHWGDSYDKGSEHTLDGKRFALEMHLVHKNKRNQVAVVGVFFQEQNTKNSELQTIIEAFPKVTYKGNKSYLPLKLNLNKLLPANPSTVYRYMGSLTTPGCDEGVTWSIITKHLPVGNKQMAEFRKLYSVGKNDVSPSCKLSNNFRPVQPLNGRKVYISQ